MIVTLIADNYFGYCKKEVKTQISSPPTSAGGLEEEHAGGALAFASYNLGYEFDARDYSRDERSFDDVALKDHELLDLRPDGYAVDRQVPELLYIPADAKASIQRLQIWWFHDGREYRDPARGRQDLHDALRLQGPSGEAPGGRELAAGRHGRRRRLLPQAVHGQRRRQERDQQELARLHDVRAHLRRRSRTRLRSRPADLRSRLLDPLEAGLRPDYAARPSRPVLSPERSLGSVIKLLTPSDDYTDDYNRLAGSFPNYIYPIVFIIKRFYHPEWLGHWRDHLRRRQHQRLSRARAEGFWPQAGRHVPARRAPRSHGWRTFKVRQDFAAAAKVPDRGRHLCLGRRAGATG